MKTTALRSKRGLFTRIHWVFSFLLCPNVYSIHTEFKLAGQCCWISAVICEPTVFPVTPANHWGLAPLIPLFTKKKKMYELPTAVKALALISLPRSATSSVDSPTHLILRDQKMLETCEFYKNRKAALLVQDTSCDRDPKKHLMEGQSCPLCCELKKSDQNSKTKQNKKPLPSTASSINHKHISLIDLYFQRLPQFLSSEKQKHIIHYMKWDFLILCKVYLSKTTSLETQDICVLFIMASSKTLPFWAE